MLLEQEVNNNYKPKLIKDFCWFEETFKPIIEQSFVDFWEKPYIVKLVSSSENNFALFKTEEFFATKIGLKKNLNVGIRIAKSTVKMVFECLGQEEGEIFDITQITEIEAKIITSFNEYVYENFKNLLKIPSEKFFEEPENVNLVFFITNEKGEMGKYIVTLPKPIVNPQLITSETFDIDISNFRKSKTDVDIAVGITKMSLNELKSLTAEDIVVLDDSNLNIMKIKINGEEAQFNVAPDPTLIVNLEDNGDNEIMESTSLSQDMWDNIQVEIGAEFDKVKISLGELKQISEGLVVDIGSVYENKIFLKVENKNIAEGELVIINDRYGVRIDRMYDDKEQTEVETVSQEDTGFSDTEQQPSSDDEMNEDDFDYSDFEIEDDNI